MNQIPKAEAAILISLFWLGFTVVRVIIIPISAKVSSIWIILCGQLLFTTSCLMLLLFSYDNRVLYIGTIMFGCGMGPLYGGSLTWLTEHISLRHGYLSLILILTCGGSMASPPIVSPWIEDYPEVLTITITVCSFLMLIMLAIMVICAHLTGQKSSSCDEKMKNVDLSNHDSLQQKKSGLDNLAIQIHDEVDGFGSRM